MIFHYPTMYLTSALAVISVAMAMMELKYVPGLIPCEKAVLYALMNRYSGTSLLQNILGCLRSSRSKLCFFVFFSDILDKVLYKNNLRPKLPHRRNICHSSFISLFSKRRLHYSLQLQQFSGVADDP